MSDTEKSQWRVNTFMTAMGMLGSVACIILGIMIKLQVDNMELKNDKAILIMMSNVQEKYVSKSDMAALVENQHKLDDSIGRLTTMSAENNNDIKLIKNQLASKNKNYPQNYP